MMHASMEEGRTPLAGAPAAEEQARAASRRAVVLENALRALLLVHLVLLVPLALAPFTFSLRSWASQQLSSWSFESSVADWLALLFVRDVLVLGLLIAGGRSRRHPVAARHARRAAIGSLLYGVCRLSFLDWEVPNAEANFVAAVAFSAVTEPVGVLLSHLLLRAREAVVVAETPPQDTAADAGDSQYSNKGLGTLQMVRVMKPYFWPSTGDPWEVRVNRLRSILTWVCVAGSKGFNLVTPIFLANATNSIVSLLKQGTDPQKLTLDIVLNLGMYAMLIFISKALKELQSLVYIKVQQAAYIEIAETTFVHLHGLSLDWHLRKKMGNVIRSMDRGIAAAQQTMQYVFLYLVPTLAEAAAVVLIFVFHYQNVRLALFIFLNLFLYIYATVKITLWRKHFRTATTKHDNELHDRLTDSLVNYETIKYFTAEDYERREYSSVVRKYQSASMATQASLSLLNVLQQLIVNTALAGGMIIASAHILETHGDIGDFVAVNSYIINVFTPLSFLGTIYNMVVTALVDMLSFGQLLGETSEVQDKPNAPDLDLARGGEHMVEFKSVSFNYSKQPMGRSIKGVSFAVPRGSSCALVGTTGAGKTTVTRLLFRFYDVTAGQVCLNGQDVRNITQRSLRGCIGMVPQDVVMFNSTIAHNISYGRIDHATQEDIERAAESAQLMDFIRQQTLGFDTVVGERGLKLSGGEKQRLAIARCLVKDPAIVVLDEATSALDSQTEQRVQQALNVLSQARTVIAIAHRLSTVRGFDQILVLDNGEIVEHGSHDNLIARERSKYALMWQRQAAGSDDSEGAVPNGSDGAGVGLAK